MTKPLPPEDVQSYPRPAIAEPVSHRIQVTFGGVPIVDTTQAIRVLETHHAPTYYIPRDDIQAELSEAEGRSFCEWKGVAHYFDVIAGNTVAHRAAWTYTSPSPGFASINGYIAFYASKMDQCSVGGINVLPQQGDFYGGWITPNLTGIVKGGPGTEHW